MSLTLRWLSVADHSISLNGDGRDDYVWIDPNTGDFYGWINKGRQNGGWLWHSIGKIANNIGASAAAVQFVDIDGTFCLLI